MIDCAETVGGNNDNLDAGGGQDQVEQIEVFTERGEEAAGTFNKKSGIFDFRFLIFDFRKVGENRANVPSDVVHSDLAIVRTGSDEWSERFSKMVRIDLVQSEIAFLKRMKQFCICAAAGTEWFECERGNGGLAKVGKEQSREDGFADPSVSAGNENYSGL